MHSIYFVFSHIYYAELVSPLVGRNLIVNNFSSYENWSGIAFDTTGAIVVRKDIWKEIGHAFRRFRNVF